MKKLVDKKGRVRFGIFDEPVETVNYLDYPLRTPMGYKFPSWMRRIRANQFCFVGIPGRDFTVGLAVVDLHTVASGFFYVCERASGRIVETSALCLPKKNIFIDPRPDRVKARFRSRKLSMELDSGIISARGRGISLNARMGLDDINPLRICTRTDYRGWAYVQKTNPVKISGKLGFEGKTLPVSQHEYMASIDWTAGYMRRKTWWNWLSASGTLPGGRAFGINLSCGVNETSFTENFFVIDRQMTKVDTVYFDFDSDDLFKPWRICSFDGKVDLRFLPEAYRGEKLSAIVLASRFSQLAGTCEGMLKTDSGEEVAVEDVAGLAEDHYAKW
ncbi:MAG: DUF2804 domain-containing protein [Thermodesulfobacteriota bacterium]